ncbi:hypothetical protein C8R45DRAFT_1148147 [Mycena sanguinolenta]|nr:hypothetical protein C8R45DRAFT_1148147 [Mycena sanguinolenta]
MHTLGVVESNRNSEFWSWKPQGILVVRYPKLVSQLENNANTGVYQRSKMESLRAGAELLPKLDDSEVVHGQKLGPRSLMRFSSSYLSSHLQNSPPISGYVGWLKMPLTPGTKESYLGKERWRDAKQTYVIFTAVVMFISMIRRPVDKRSIARRLWEQIASLRWTNNSSAPNIAIEYKYCRALRFWRLVWIVLAETIAACDRPGERLPVRQVIEHFWLKNHQPIDSDAVNAETKTRL